MSDARPAMGELRESLARERRATAARSKHDAVTAGSRHAPPWMKTIQQPGGLGRTVSSGGDVSEPLPIGVQIVMVWSDFWTRGGWRPSKGIYDVCFRHPTVELPSREVMGDQGSVIHDAHIPRSLVAILVMVLMLLERRKRGVHSGDSGTGDDAEMG